MFNRPGIVLYCGKFCPSCAQAKRALDMNNLQYEVVMLDGQPDLVRDLEAHTGLKVVPQIFVNGRCIGSTPEMFQLMKSGEFSNYL